LINTGVARDGLRAQAMMRDVPMDDAEIERALVIAAHPDDADFGSAGTVATWTAQGMEVSYCIITSGDAGGFDPTVPRSEIPGIRESEQRAAAAEVGVKDVTFLGYPDGALEVTHALRRDLSRVIRQVRPQRVICQSPERNWQRVFASHPDHLRAGEAAMCAIYPDSRNPFAHPELLAEGFVEWTVSEIWITAAPSHLVNHYVDITDVFDRKVAALRAHVSQTEHVDLETLLRGWLGAQAAAAGWGPGRLAEAFHVVSAA
jgi:LmbE family N-acetylglucosaminyl deacetylase